MQYTLAGGVQQRTSGKSQVKVGGHAADTAERWMKGVLVIAVLSLVGGFISGGNLFAIERVSGESFNYGAGIALGIGGACPGSCPSPSSTTSASSRDGPPTGRPHLVASWLRGPSRRSTLRPRGKRSDQSGQRVRMRSMASRSAVVTRSP